MNLIDLTWLLYFAGGGAYIGNSILSGVGALLGGLAGWGLLIVLAWLVKVERRRMPCCQCGFTYQDMVHEQHLQLGFVCRCPCCNSLYMVRKGKFWYEVGGDGQARLIRRRSFWGVWMPPKQNGF